ncbi:MAG: prepilin-type N-terminal cleavage/methylation domain-containing protein [Planctomycetes bacterium]|nr:prepilin-type N-terminal cleavage/methylation domain-containing protein [Planctomycetota bacterium]
MKSSYAHPDRSHRQIRRTASGTRLSRHGMTLVEMLVAMALSLLIILAVTQVFRLVGDNVLASRAVLEMAGQLRGTADQLQGDLDGLTVPVRPWPDASSGLGYFEYYEGPLWDMGLGPMGAPGRYSESSVGDIDDVLMFTARSKGEPFAGQILGTIDYTNPNRPRLLYNPAAPQMSVIYSQVAEIAWFTRFNDWNGNTFPDPGEVTLHRRVFLVLPNLDLTDPSIQTLSSLQFYSAFDISVATVETGPGVWTRRANSLEDLTRRENRIAHYGSGAFPVIPPPSRSYPYHFWRALLAPQGTVITYGNDGQPGVAGDNDDGVGAADDSIGEAGQFGSDDLAIPVDVPFPLLAPFAETYGSDVILSQLLAFDVKAYDPYAPTRQSASTMDSLTPGDPGYDAAGLAIGQGAFVDLYYNRYLAVPAASLFSGPPSLRSAVGTAPLIWGTPSFSSTYDTWSLYYEHNGVDEDGDGLVDEGTNGFDDDGINGVDDVGERETAPPYPVPLRGIQVRLRIIDNDSRQVRQVTVTTNFIPE